MGRRRNKEYYAVIRGFYIDTPTIFSFWGDAHPLITGFPSSISKYFKTLADAEGYMKAQGVKQYSLVIKEGAGETTPEKNQAAYYAVAHGRTPGIRRYYYGKGGAEPDVVGFDGNCHKHFRSLAQAEAFLEDWKEMNARVVKVNTEDRLLKSCRSDTIKGAPVELCSKAAGGGDDDDDLVDGLSKLRM